MMKHIRLSIENEIAEVIFQSAYINREMAEEFRAAVNGLAHNPAVQVVIFTGVGTIFLNGPVQQEYRQLPPTEACAFAVQVKNVLWAMASLPQVTIAAVNGSAESIGCAAALCCDIRIASEQASFSYPGLSIMPGFLGAKRLFRLIGPGYAKEMIFAGEPVYASRARAMGLVNHIVSQKEMMDNVCMLAEKIRKNGNYLLKQTLDAIAFSEQEETREII